MAVSVEEQSEGYLSNRIALIAVLIIFGLSCLGLFAVYLSFPHMRPEERPYVKLPTSLEDAKNLGRVLSNYTDDHFLTVLLAFFLTYIFLQSFAIPGSIFLSFLSGFLFPFLLAITLVCLCSAIGASLCYLISYSVGRRLVLHYIPERVAKWKLQVCSHRTLFFSYAIHRTYIYLYLYIIIFWIDNWRFLLFFSFPSPLSLFLLVEMFPGRQTKRQHDILHNLPPNNAFPAELVHQHNVAYRRRSNFAVLHRNIRRRCAAVDSCNSCGNVVTAARLSQRSVHLGEHPALDRIRHSLPYSCSLQDEAEKEIRIGQPTIEAGWTSNRYCRTVLRAPELTKGRRGHRANSWRRRLACHILHVHVVFGAWMHWTKKKNTIMNAADR